MNQPLSHEESVELIDRVMRGFFGDTIFEMFKSGDTTTLTPQIRSQIPTKMYQQIKNQINQPYNFSQWGVEGNGNIKFFFDELHTEGKYNENAVAFIKSLEKSVEFLMNTVSEIAKVFEVDVKNRIQSEIKNTLNSFAQNNPEDYSHMKLHLKQLFQDRSPTTEEMTAEVQAYLNGFYGQKVSGFKVIVEEFVLSHIDNLCDIHQNNATIVLDRLQ